MLPVSMSTTVAVAGAPSVQLRHAVDLGKDMLTLFLDGLATLVSFSLSTKPAGDIADTAKLTVYLTDVLAFSILLFIFSTFASASPPRVPVLAELLDSAAVLSSASVLASLASLLVQPRLRWAVYSLFMACTLAVLILRQPHWKLLRRLWSHVPRLWGVARDWFLTHVVTRQEMEVENYIGGVV